ncbi:putative transcription factor bHLH family [Rosa chinensis]|uniref:Putative transcription factor bHLH family n=1 Tax=Rosa chinensis TaxID=74649 RepID=A0A2P6Q5D7_ROSCH|nr:transcription factor bHLH144 [Rosa chinensis]PRQ29395.1 putative transcription factor bHLH family [Rosa chinensis]
MQSDQAFDPNKAARPFANQVGNNYMHMPVASPFGTVLPHDAMHYKPFHGVEFQTSDICPKNFIIFDQTDHRSQIMFNPAIAHKISGPAFDICAAYMQDNLGLIEGNNENRETSSSLKEDSDDIDALLSLEDEEEQEEYDEEEVSTARTHGNYGSSYSDSCSSYGLKTRNEGQNFSLEKTSGIGSSSSSSCNSERKRKKMKKMVRALRGIVPGGNEMNTVAVIDEAVQYLKSLKVEMQKLGVGNLNN